MLPILALLGSSAGKMAGAKLLQSGIGGSLASPAMKAQGGAAAGEGGGILSSIMDTVGGMMSGGDGDSGVSLNLQQNTGQQETGAAGQQALQQAERSNQERMAEAQRIADEERKKRLKRNAQF